jgi:AraC-like DNA-binding protein
MIPCFGSLTFTSQEYRFTARAGHSLALLTGPGNRVETSLDSHVVTLFDKSRLLRTSRSMLGLEDEAPVDLNLEQARAVSTSPAGLSMGGGLGNLFQTMDQLPSANLGMLGLDDVFYRTLAVILSPQVASAFVNPGTGRRPPPTRPEIDAVCDYILGHLEQPLGLTQLERVSGLSARSLQYAFRKQFQCTPMQWVSEARLGLGHRLLSAAKPGDRVAGVALSCGFTDFGAFSTAYRARYGTSPSETLRLALGRC